MVLNRIKSLSLSIPFVSCRSPKKVRRRELICLTVLVRNLLWSIESDNYLELGGKESNAKK